MWLLVQRWPCRLQPLQIRLPQRRAAADRQHAAVPRLLAFLPEPASLVSHSLLLIRSSHFRATKFRIELSFRRETFSSAAQASFNATCRHTSSTGSAPIHQSSTAVPHHSSTAAAPPESSSTANTPDLQVCQDLFTTMSVRFRLLCTVADALFPDRLRVAAVLSPVTRTHPQSAST